MATVPTDAQLATQAAQATLRQAARTTKSNSTKRNVRAASTDAASQVTATAIPWQLGSTNWDANKNNTTGFRPKVGKGYDATAGGLNAQRKAKAMAQANAYLLDGNKGLQVPMFVSSTNIDTQLAGATAQSQLVQDFYPRNFVQPVVNVSGWSLDQEDYGTLCEFVHTCQFNALSTDQLWTTSMTQLIVLGRTGLSNSQGIKQAAKAPVGTRTNGRRVTASFNNNSSHDESHINQTIKGDHENIIAKGYIQSMTRAHEQFQYAVYWQFDFVVAQMVDGPFRENIAMATNVATGGIGMAAKLLADAKTVGLSTITSKQNTASLAYAATHSNQLANPTPTGGSSPSSSSSTSPSTPSPSSGGTPSGTSVPTNAWNPDSKPIANWIVPIITWAAKHGWSGTISSGFRTHAEQLAAATGYVASIGTTIAAEYPNGVYASNHCTANYPGGAVDVTDSSTLASVLGGYPGKPGLVWGQTTIEDGVHFSATGH
jgi:hypothetical protein